MNEENMKLVIGSGFTGPQGSDVMGSSFSDRFEMSFE